MINSHDAIFTSNIKNGTKKNDTRRGISIEARKRASVIIGNHCVTPLIDTAVSQLVPSDILKIETKF